MHIVQRVFGALFLLGGLFACVGAWLCFDDGNKNDAMGWGVAAGGGLFFALVLLATSGKKKPPIMQGQYPGQGYPQQQQQQPYPPRR